MNQQLLRLDPNPSHVHMPTEVEMEHAGVPYVSWTPAQCKTCSGTRRFWWYDNAASPDRQPAEWECDCEEQLVLSRWLGVAGIPTHLQRARQSDLTGWSDAAKWWAQSYWKEVERNVRNGIGAVLRGGTGSGKTIISTLVLKAVMKMGYTGYFFDVGTHLKDMQTRGAWSEEQRQWIERRLRRADVLVLDGFDDRKGAQDWMRYFLAALVRYRVNAQVPTLLTVTATEDQIREIYGNDTLDLLHAVGGVQDISLAESFRDAASKRLAAEGQAGLTRPIVFI